MGLLYSGWEYCDSFIFKINKTAENPIISFLPSTREDVCLVHNNTSTKAQLRAQGLHWKAVRSSSAKPPNPLCSHQQWASSPTPCTSIQLTELVPCWTASLHYPPCGHPVLSRMGHGAAQCQAAVNAPGAAANGPASTEWHMPDIVVCE